MNKGLEIFLSIIAAVAFISIFPLIGWLLTNFVWFRIFIGVVGLVVLIILITIFIYQLWFSN